MEASHGNQVESGPQWKLLHDMEMPDSKFQKLSPHHQHPQLLWSGKFAMEFWKVVIVKSSSDWSRYPNSKEHLEFSFHCTCWLSQF